jgi:hypothetical protein
MGHRKESKRHSPGNCLIVASVLLANLAAASARAAPSRRAQERTARKACLAGDYVKGVSILSDLFVDTQDATYIFNQGRCFEQNLRYEDAIGRFQEYLRAGTNLKRADKAAAEKHISDCQELLAKQTARTAQPVVPPSPIVQEAPPPPAPAPPPPPIAIQRPAAKPSGNGSGLRTAGIITAAAGGAAVIAGVILNVKVNSMASDMESTPGGYSPSKESDRETLETLGWIGYGVGAACVATGAVLYVVGLRRRSGESGNLALLPEFGPARAGAVLRGAF